jgi:phosphohistidine phosphatase
MASSCSVFLIRHGIAAERGDQWPDDTKRPLLPRGIARLRRSGDALAVLGVQFDVMLTSPLMRARQTAETLAARFSPPPPVRSVDSLAPGGSFASIVQDLAANARSGRVACVGHEPDLGELAARLLGTKTPIEFKKGSICRIDFDDLPSSGTGRLRWFLSPRILRHLRT